MKGYVEKRSMWLSVIEWMSQILPLMVILKTYTQKFVYKDYITGITIEENVY